MLRLKTMTAYHLDILNNILNKLILRQAVPENAEVFQRLSI